MHLRNQYFSLKYSPFRRFISENTFFPNKSTMWYGFLEDQDFLTCCSVSSIVFIRLNKANRSCLLFFFCLDLFLEVHFRIPPRGVSSEMNFRNTTFSENVTLFRRCISEINILY